MNALLSVPGLGTSTATVWPKQENRQKKLRNVFKLKKTYPLFFKEKKTNKSKDIFVKLLNYQRLGPDQTIFHLRLRNDKFCERNEINCFHPDFQR